MSLYKDDSGLYRSSLLNALPWLAHGFGTASARFHQDFRTLQQVHGIDVYRASECGDSTQGDGLMTDRPGEFIAVKTADCVPVLIADPVRRAVAAVHAGWRGTQQGIAAAAVRRMTEDCGSRPRELLVALGPCINACCFEVGPEVSVLFESIFPERGDLRNRASIDLREANRRGLLAAGVLPEHMHHEGPCTCCGGDEFYSWRRDKRKGERMFSVIGVTE